MRILISNDGMHAHHYIRIGWAKALSYAGHEVMLWDIRSQPAFDVFDEFDPNFFIGQTYNLDRATFKCIAERPQLKVIMKAPDWGDVQKDIDSKKYQVLFASDADKTNIEKLKQSTGKPDFVYAHYLDEDIKYTHNKWEEIGVKTSGMLNAADIFEYVNGKEISYLKSDMSFIGGCWPYKAQSFDKYLTPLFNPPGRYNIKIFGNQPWHQASSHVYMGFVSDGLVKDIMKSATICPNISEPHAQDFGIDVNERVFKILSNKSFCISDNITALTKIFDNDEVIFASTPSEFKETVDHFIEHPQERLPYIQKGYSKIVKSHTYFHRVAKMFRLLGLDEEVKKCNLALEKMISTIENYEQT